MEFWVVPEPKNFSIVLMFEYIHEALIGGFSVIPNLKVILLLGKKWKLV